MLANTVPEGGLATPGLQIGNSSRQHQKLEFRIASLRELSPTIVYAGGESIIKIEFECYHVKSQNNSLAIYAPMQDNDPRMKRLRDGAGRFHHNNDLT
jgi:hypothetical protein